MGRNDSQGRHSGHKKDYGRIMPDRFALAQSPLYGLYPCPGGGIRTASNSACLGLVVPRMTRICRRQWQFDPKLPCHRLHHGLVHSKQLPGFLAPKPSGSIAAQPSAWVAKFPARTANCSASQPVLSCPVEATRRACRRRVPLGLRWYGSRRRPWPQNCNVIHSPWLGIQAALAKPWIGGLKKTRRSVKKCSYVLLLCTLLGSWAMYLSFPLPLFACPPLCHVS